MSRIGQSIINIPDGVEVKKENSKFWAKGSKGELTAPINDCIQVTITEDDPIEDNTTKVINELVDLWLELRAIRNAVEYNDDDYAYQNVKEPSALEKYTSKVKELEEEWEDSENYLNKIFRDNIDPSVLAYLHLDDDDKLLLTN